MMSFVIWIAVLYGLFFLWFSNRVLCLSLIGAGLLFLFFPMGARMIVIGVVAVGALIVALN